MRCTLAAPASASEQGAAEMLTRCCCLHMLLQVEVEEAQDMQSQKVCAHAG